ncbi:xanthine dehydrogenase [Skermanella stibiiresistens SB22]|uniref:Xanthine dehydrogenase n=1 Tax=Skermanella stibiiresistens SB22 TaxID=1385369 RepID=W9GR33_9PROT|nr:XdhC family protein [Skermanella stibiiresistens]EWY36204.1 xanthine dehydrogenase [Skermanella stibiiresistens SB22]
MKTELLQRLVTARAEKRPVALVTDLGSGMQTLVGQDVAHGGFGLDREELAEVQKYLREDRSGIVEIGDSRLFIHSYNPPLRVIIIGAVHIAQALAPMASLAGYDVVVVDPRRAFATDARFPGITMNGEWPDDALKELVIDSRTAIVTLTHDPKLDDPALHVALRSPAFYVGSLGSRKTHGKRVDRLREAGYSESEISRIHAPVGLAIDAVSPAEIALAIMAQITQVLRREPSSSAAAA